MTDEDEFDTPFGAAKAFMKLSQEMDEWWFWIRLHIRFFNYDLGPQQWEYAEYGKNGQEQETSTQAN